MKPNALGTKAPKNNDQPAKFFITILLLLGCFFLKGQGSRVLAPNYQGTGALVAPTSPAPDTNDDFAWLEHDSGLSGNFLDPSAPADERVYVYLRDGETLRYGIRRIARRYQAGVAYGSATIEGGNNQDVTIIIYDNGGTIVQATHYGNDTGSDGDATLISANGVTDVVAPINIPGIIDDVAESLIGPEFTFNSITYNSGGYDPREYTNNTGSDQSFYIAFLQDDYTFSDEATLITAINGATIADINERSWYDLWDFTVYDGAEEKTGRLYSRRWNFTAQYFENRLADEFLMYVRVPSTIGGGDAGNYIKQVDIGGLDPFSLVMYANSEGSDGTGGDTNGDGVTDFQDFRQGQLTDNGYEEYDLFLENPDIDVWPTTILPTVTITDATFYCNAAGTGGEGTITIESNQTGYVAIVLDLDGTSGYQAGTEDVIVEAEIATEGSATIRWDGLNGLGAAVPSGTPVTVTGRFTAGPIHIPMFDVEESPEGINMLDVRPSTSFDLIYWDDSSLTGGNATGSNPTSELDGTNTSTHLWSDDTDNGGDDNLVNTWSFGYYQVNTQNINFTYTCDDDGDGIEGSADLDSDNDGVLDSVEGDIYADADADNIPNYLDADFAGYTDSNGDGVNDNFDTDLDGIPDALDVDSDNDGIPDMVENGLTDSNNDGTLDEGAGITDTFENGVADLYDVNCDGNPVVNTGYAESVFSESGVNGANPSSNALGASGGDTQYAEIDAVNDNIVFYLGRTVASGTTITIRMDRNGGGGASGTADIEESADGTTFIVAAQNETISNTPSDYTYTLTNNADYLRITHASETNGFIDTYIIEISYSYTLNCSGGAALSTIDTDGDGVDNSLDLDSDNDGIVDVIEAGGSANSLTGQIDGFTDSNGNGFNDTQESVALSQPDSDSDGVLADLLDIDSDNDGILDNVEGQDSQSAIASVAGDTDGDGLLDVYDPNNGGTLIVPVDTDSNGTEDYLDSDADGDGVADYIEGRDADKDGFSDLDSDEDGLISDETGHNLDGDSDGLWNIFESSTAPTQNTDVSGKADWQDTDDDNDGILTAGEDVNTNGDWTDDKTQGQGGSADVPDYLYRGDYDGDAIADASDLDSDNDGILDSTEDNGAAIDPSGDMDSDGISNYQDDDIDGDMTVNTSDSDTGGVNTTTYTDSNGDSTIDLYDTDLDGVPDFLDLDSDNDGIWDIVEANQGSAPFGTDLTTAQLMLQDPDNDGLMNYVDSDDVSSGGTSDLANPDTDSDGISDYLDIDSDDDGITDIIEAQTTAAFIAFVSTDVDADGLADVFDPSEGGTELVPVNSDGIDTQDYIDTDSDNDGIRDIIEGDDTDEDGYGDWDSDEDNDETDEASFSTDADNDGLKDLFDTVTLGTAGNEVGSNADLQNSDAIDFKNWRDSDDDNDGNVTADEDANDNGNWADDQTAGQAGDIPDFLFFNDFDGDGYADASDVDSDNDGIADVDEDNEGTGTAPEVDPSADADSDGIPNYKDADVPTGLDDSTDSNGDGIYDIFDTDLDGIPNFRDRDSDNDGVPDLVEAGGTDAVNADGVADNSTDTDMDGLVDTYDVDNGGTTLTPSDADSDGHNDGYDLDSDNDGITDLVEFGGIDSDGNGIYDDLSDTDKDGLANGVDGDNFGSALSRPDTDNDGVFDYLDVDSDNDGVPDPVDNGGIDTNNDGRIDGFSSDTDGDGLADIVDPDNGGTPISNADTDGDGIKDYLDLDSDNDGYPDILEAGGTDSDEDGIVNNTVNSDADSDNDTVPDNVDVDNSGSNGGSGSDDDGDEIDNTFDVDETGGSDTDGDSIDDAFDTDADGDGFDDDAKATPYGQEDKESDGLKDFRDLDSDGDGIVDVIEFGQTADASTGTISGFTDTNSNGWNDAQEGSIFTITNTDSDGFNDYQDIDSDNDGLPDNIESQTKATYIAISDVDSDNDGLDDAYDPNNGGTLISPVTTGTGNEDYLESDSDEDNVSDNIEGANDDKSQYADWDTDSDNDPTDESGWNTDTDSDGLFDLFDNDASTSSANVTGSTSNGQDSDLDGIWDFQDVDDDGDGTNTSAEDDEGTIPDPTDDFGDGGTPVPDYLFGDQDIDNDGVANSSDQDSDNDGLADSREDGGVGIDPSGDTDGDGISNYQDEDIDGDAILNVADTDGDGSGTNTTSFTDTNLDSVIDQFDHDLDGIPDFLDLDSDNDGIADIIEFGLTDANEDGTLYEGSAITDLNANGFEDSVDPSCDGVPINNNGFATSVFSESGVNGANPSSNALGESTDDLVYAEIDAVGDNIVFYLGRTVSSGTTITIRMDRNGGGGQTGTADIEESADGTTFIVAAQNEAIANTPGDYTYTLTNNADYIRITHASETAGGLDTYIIELSYTYTTANPCSGGSAIVLVDTDSDGINNHQDLDSDNDGITDNVEAQAAGSYTAPVSGDADTDGLLDVYDGSGNALSPVNTDSPADAIPDYLDTDSDDDGVNDQVEAFDSNSDGYGSWDSDTDGSITDESGYNVDSDGDGIWLVFDNSSGIGTIANITGTNTDRQDTDGDGTEDWRDNDDDGDGTVTGDASVGAGSGEDGNSNGDWADDFGQGGGTVPDYLYNPDVDGDGIVDQTDLDSDQDGIPNTDEYQGAVYASGGTPFDDNDADGIYNYLDTSDGGNTSFTDANGDGVDDQVDQDRDGVPNFFDLDSDNDGIMDGIEANDGTVPTGFNTTTGRFGVDNSGGDDDDDDNDGLHDNVDGTPLAKSDFDSDGLDDYLDLDSENDGLTDHVEGLTTAAFTNPSGNDTDNDGLDDTFDADNGGTAVVPTNTDGTDEPDYRDTDTDNDNDGDGVLRDQVEGYDANKNGFSELDIDQDGLLTDETGYNTDTDGDGIWDLFDSFSGRGANNIIGTDADLQDTDNDGVPDFRDQDDDGDALSTANEDVNNNGDWTDDKDQGGGATPDYLFFNDSDLDRVADGVDNDGDNDGIPDTQEYDTGTLRNPFGDQDMDGIFNWNDSDDPTNLVGGALTDSNADGVWDEYDWDLDGVPNFFDLDSDNDGIPDIVEAGGTDSNNDAIIDGIVDSDSDGIFDNVDVNATGGNDTNNDGIDDVFQDGTDTDGDGIEDTADLDVDGNGIIDTLDPGQGGTALADPDSDGDGVNDILDRDSDNDGIFDLIEGGGSEADGDGQLDSFGDTDGDGWGNAVDSDNGGTALSLPNTDGAGERNYLDMNSDGDSDFDWDEGFDDDEDGDHLDDYAARALAYETANGTPGHYPTTDTSPANGTPDYLDDDDTDNVPNYLDPDDTYWRDSDSDGIVDLLDPDITGTSSYGGVSGIPDNDFDGVANFVDNDDNTPLPLDWVSFTVTYSNGKSNLVWETVNEINVSHFDIEHSLDGESFDMIGNLNANNKTSPNTYSYTHQSPVQGINYYRLKQVDFDGAYDYSWVRYVAVIEGKISYIIYPNPAQNQVTITADAVITGEARMIDLEGKIVWTGAFRGTSQLDVDMANFKDGIYQLVINTPAGTVYKKVVKRN